MSNGEDDLMDFGPLKIEESAKNVESITDKNKGFVYRTNRRVKIPTIVLLPKMKSTKKYKSQKTERREKIKDKALDSNAPSLVYEEGDIIKRTIRDTYDNETKNVYVEGNDC